MTINDIRTQLHNWVDQGDAKILKMLYAISKVYFTDSKTVTPAENELYRMVYTSARSSKCDDSNIDDILEKSRKNNPDNEITGLLLYTDDRFIQILEGPLYNVMNTYNRISKDNRHAGTQIRFFEKVTERHFSNWHMGSKNINFIQLSDEESMPEKERALYRSLADGDLFSYQDQGMRVLKTFLAIA